MKYANTTCHVRWSGGAITLVKGKTTADDDHPLVRERPELWTDEPPAPDLPGPSRLAAGSKVERATRAPGERRGVARR